MLPYEEKMNKERGEAVNSPKLCLDYNKISSASKEELVKYIQILDKTLNLATYDVYTAFLGNNPSLQVLLKLKIGYLKDVEIFSNLFEVNDNEKIEEKNINKEERKQFYKIEDSENCVKYDEKKFIELDSLFEEIMK